MKRLIYLLPVLLVLSFTSCKDRVPGDTDHAIQIEDQEPETMQNPGNVTHSDETYDNEGNQAYVTSGQLQDLHKNLNLTAEQEKQLKDIRSKRNDTINTYSSEENMDRDYNQVLNDEQSTSYQNWKNGNLKVEMHRND